MEENSTPNLSNGVQFWLWRLALVAAITGSIAGVLLTQRYALALVAGAGVVLAVASATLPRQDKAGLLEDFVIGLLAGLAYGVAFIGLGLGQGEMPLSHAAIALTPFLAACGVLAVAEILWSRIRQHPAPSDRPSPRADVLGVVLGMLFGAGVAFLCGGYLGIHLPIL
ncbi:MAG: hypothetical protein NTW86_19935 [Candidatus Sumerlaeota bacterium]|nr:hypothetical protein [Candidatus Sumerlaeota bacterium]